MRLVYRPNHPMRNEFGMVDASIAGPKHVSAPAPGIISDTMGPTKHMANGKMYDSKSEFRKATKAAGCIEVGSETATMLKPRQPVKLDRRQRVNAIRRVVYELQNGRK